MITSPDAPNARVRTGRKKARTTNRFAVLLTTPTMVWMLLFRGLPIYVLFAIAFGGVDPIFQLPFPVWSPFDWTTKWMAAVWSNLLGGDSAVFARTGLYVAIASVGCVLIGYPLAYFAARCAGRWKGLVLMALVLPFFISYLMRMVAWMNLLQTDGYFNAILNALPFAPHDVNWLVGNPVTVVIGLTYGYVPYIVLPLYAALDAIPQRLLDAAFDLGANRASVFWRVTLPLTRPAVVTGLFIVALPMIGDYYTTNLLSGSPSTAMIGNVIDNAANSSGQGPQAAAYTLLLLIVLLIPVYLYARYQRKGFGQ
jgi:ABC-type spermidine/putrescine transport system permease subunit I